MARNINYSDKNKNGIEQRKLVLKNNIRCRYGYSIAKDTEVDVTIETINGKKYYRVFYPGSDTLCFQVKPKDFVSLEEIETMKTNLKVGDEFWFVTVTNQEMFKSKIFDIQRTFAYLKKNKGIIKIRLNDLILKSMTPFGIYVNNGEFQAYETVYFSKDELEVKNKTLQLILEAKEHKMNEIDRLSKLHSKEIGEFESLEKKEKEISKLLGKEVS